MNIIRQYFFRLNTKIVKCYSAKLIRISVKFIIIISTVWANIEIRIVVKANTSLKLSAVEIKSLFKNVGLK